MFKYEQRFAFTYKINLDNINSMKKACKIIYSVEGNIGSGKTSLLNIIQATLPNVKIHLEPVAQWQKYNLLELYYQDPQRWAFTFQVNAVLSRMAQLNNMLNKTENDVNDRYFTQRSIIADKQIFAKLLFKQNKMTQMEYELYNNMYNQLDSLFKIPKTHKFIYLRTSPKVCYERMKKRNRTEELKIPLKYFQEIHQLHEQWLANNSNALIVDGEKEFQRNTIRSGQILNSVETFF